MKGSLTNILSNNDLKVHDPWWYCALCSNATFWPPNTSTNIHFLHDVLCTLGTSTSHWKQWWNSKSNFSNNLMVGLPGKFSTKNPTLGSMVNGTSLPTNFTYKKMVVPWTYFGCFYNHDQGLEPPVDLNIPDVRCLPCTCRIPSAKKGMASWRNIGDSAMTQRRESRSFLGLQKVMDWY